MTHCGKLIDVHRVAAMVYLAGCRIKLSVALPCFQHSIRYRLSERRVMGRSFGAKSGSSDPSWLRRRLGRYSVMNCRRLNWSCRYPSSNASSDWLGGRSHAGASPWCSLPCFPQSHCSSPPRGFMGGGVYRDTTGSRVWYSPGAGCGSG